MAAKSNSGFFKSEAFRGFMGKYGVSVIMLFMIIAIAVARPMFLSSTNLLNVCTQISIKGC